MSWQATDRVWRLDMGGDTTAKVVLLALAYRLGIDSADAWPSLGRIATDTELGRTAIQNAIRRLTEAGHVEVIHTPGHTSRYRLTTADPPTRRAGTRTLGGPPNGRGGPTRRAGGAHEAGGYREQDFEHELEPRRTAPPPRQRAAAPAAEEPRHPAVGVVDIHRGRTHPVALGHVGPADEPVVAKADFAGLHVELARRALGRPAESSDPGPGGFGKVATGPGRRLEVDGAR